MSKYLMTLTPQEPYFFGNEKSFKYPGTDIGNESNLYYIKSELMPAQTSIIGTLRYVLLPIKKNFGKYNDTDIETNGNAVGFEGFEYGKTREFGKIKGISPLFILKNRKEALITTPFDHKNGEKIYSPFSYVKTENGDIYPAEYNAKDGVSRSFMSVENGEIYEQSVLFDREVRIGINRAVDDKGFFKKDCVLLKDDFCFAVYVTLDDDVVPENTIVFMGQGKSLFTIEFEQVNDSADLDLEAKIRAKLVDNAVYCFSDAFVGSEVYQSASFAITDTRDYRAYKNKNGKVTKAPTLYRLLSAGSIFICDKSNFRNAFDDASVEVIGYNKVIIKNGGNE